MKTLKNSSCFEFFFIVWLFSYQFKNAHPLFQHPDITILLTLLLIPWAWRIGRSLNSRVQAQRFVDPTLVLFLLFSLWCVASAFWSPSHLYARSKALCLIFYIIPAFLMAYFIVARSAESLVRFLKIVCLFSLLIHVYVLYIFWMGGVRSVDIFNTNYLVTGQTIGAGFLILLTYSLYAFRHYYPGHHHLTSFWVPLLLCGTLFYVAVNLGGRGPVISMGIAGLLIYGGLARYGSCHIAGKYFLALGLTLIGIYILCNFIFMASTPIFLSRMGEAFNLEAPDKNITLRLDFYLSALQTFLQHPLVGVGFGGWPVIFGYGDILWHPHNLFLELLAETGTIGFLAFCALLWKIFRHFSLKRLFDNQISCALLGLFLFSFINAMKSGDIIDNILLFICLGIWARLKRNPLPQGDSLLSFVK